MFNKKEVITAVDIGTSKIAVLVGEADSKGRLTALGFGERPSGDCLIKGEFRKMSELSEKLIEAFEDAANTADREIDPDNIFFSVTGKQIKAQESIGTVTISNDERKIGQEEIDEAVKNSKLASLPVNTVSINYVMSDFIIDGHKKVEDPMGMIGSKLEAISFCIYGNTALLDNYKTALADAGYNIKHKADVFSAVACSQACLSDEDLRNGTLLLDIGAGTTEYILFHGSGYFDCGVLQLGCDHIANDLCAAFDIHISESRRIILEHLHSDDYLKQQFIEIPRSGTIRRIPSLSVEKVLKLRVNEIFEIITENIQKIKVKQHIGNGLIICGGGAKITPLLKIAENFFEATVRVGEVRDMDGELSKLKDPRYCCLAGLLKYGNQARFKNHKSGIIQKIDKRLWYIINNSFRKFCESFKI